eukprot:IDg5676t1
MSTVIRPHSLLSLYPATIYDHTSHGLDCIVPRGRYGQRSGLGRAQFSDTIPRGLIDTLFQSTISRGSG